MDYGWIRIGTAVPVIKLADTAFNTQKVLRLMHQAVEKKVQMLVFPELVLTGYSCGDLFYQNLLLEGAKEGLRQIRQASEHSEMLVMVGLPLEFGGLLFNCAVILQKGKILGVVPKVHLPNYDEFYEKRWFASGARMQGQTMELLDQAVPFGSDLLFSDRAKQAVVFGVEICEDLWAPISPSNLQSLAGAMLLFNLSASNDLIGKHAYRRNLVSMQSAKCCAAYIYASSGMGESSTDLVFGGHAMIAEYGTLLAETERFGDHDSLSIADVDIQRLQFERKKQKQQLEEQLLYPIRREASHSIVHYDLGRYAGTSLLRTVDAHPFVPSDSKTRDERCREIFAIQTRALVTRYRATGSTTAVIGISGGLDSTLALLVTVQAFDKLGFSRKNILAVTMPGFGTTKETYENAVTLIQSLGASLMEIPIQDACIQHFKDIGQDPEIHDVTYENAQARERTQILMDLANQRQALVIGTGDLSELALGWCTYNGDHMSMYAVNASVPKTLVRHLVAWVAEQIPEEAARAVLFRILETPISPELLPPDAQGQMRQKTEEILGAYAIHDFYLYHFFRTGARPKKLLFLAQHAFASEYDKKVLKDCLKTFLKRFFSQQFKRSCLPDGPKIGSVSLSPRGDWRMPSDASVALWLQELDQME